MPPLQRIGRRECLLVSKRMLIRFITTCWMLPFVCLGLYVIYQVSFPVSPSNLLNIKTTIVDISSLPICDDKPPDLIGFLEVDKSTNLSLIEIETIHEKDILPGKGYVPLNCVTHVDRVAIIIPFRNRDKHLQVLLYNILPFLKRQHIAFRIFVVEQIDSHQPFNKGMLLNVGFVQASKEQHFDCFILQDVDLAPENDHNLYTCAEAPRHMSSSIDLFNYTLPYRDNAGGVLTVSAAQFGTANGFSNRFWGWGGEDDDFGRRLTAHGFNITRPPPEIGMYTMLKHKPETPSEVKDFILQDGPKRYETDGINSLNYTIQEIVLHRTFTLLRVHLWNEVADVEDFKDSSQTEVLDDLKKVLQKPPSN